MNVASTVEIASVVDPNTSPSSRVHKLSRISPDDPDRKKQASSTARIADGLYTIADAPPAIRMTELDRVPRNRSSILGSRRQRAFQGQQKTSRVRARVELQATTVGLRDPFRQRQTEAGPSADLLGRVERLHDAGGDGG